MAARRPDAVDALVGDLVRDLRPVRPLPPAGMRALAWLGAACLIGLALAVLAETGDLGARLATPDLRMAAAGALLTTITAAYAAFATSVPGRSTAWALLPLPAAALWIGASGLGCLRAVLAPAADAVEAHAQAGLGCFGFLTAVSLPLSVLLVLMLRRACPLRPNLTAALAGLAAAAAAATLLVPFHPEEASVTDIAVHAITVLAVIGLNGLAGGRLLARG